MLCVQPYTLAAAARERKLGGYLLPIHSKPGRESRPLEHVCSEQGESDTQGVVTHGREVETLNRCKSG